jgi:hypothetical protein
VSDYASLAVSKKAKKNESQCRITYSPGAHSLIDYAASADAKKATKKESLVFRLCTALVLKA